MTDNLQLQELLPEVPSCGNYTIHISECEKGTETIPMAQVRGYM